MAKRLLVSLASSVGWRYFFLKRCLMMDARPRYCASYTRCVHAPAAVGAYALRSVRGGGGLMSRVESMRRERETCTTHPLCPLTDHLRAHPLHGVEQPIALCRSGRLRHSECGERWAKLEGWANVELEQSTSVGGRPFEPQSATGVHVLHGEVTQVSSSGLLHLRVWVLAGPLHVQHEQ